MVFSKLQQIIYSYFANRHLTRKGFVSTGSSTINSFIMLGAL